MNDNKESSHSYQNTPIYKKAILLQIKQEIENLNRFNLPVPAKLTKPDPLIIQAKQSLAKKRKAYQFIGMIETERGVLDIRVSPNNVEGALIFMDSLIKIFRTRGHDVIVDNNGAYAIIKDEKIQIGFKEKSKRVIVNGVAINKRDVVGIWQTESIDINWRGPVEFLILETPINQK